MYPKVKLVSFIGYLLKFTRDPSGFLAEEKRTLVEEHRKVRTSIKKKAKKLSRKHKCLVICVSNRDDTYINVDKDSANERLSLSIGFCGAKIINKNKLSKCQKSLEYLIYYHKETVKNSVATVVSGSDKTKLGQFSHIRYITISQPTTLEQYGLQDYNEAKIVTDSIGDQCIRKEITFYNRGSGRMYIPLYTKRLGELNFLGCDNNYSLCYSPSAGKYIAGCREFTREQAIEHWSINLKNCASSICDWRDIVYRRAELFLKLINDHQPEAQKQTCTPTLQ